MKSYTIPFNIFDRVIAIGRVLPAEASYETGIVVRDLRKKITLTQEEIAKVNFETHPDPRDPQRANFTWNVQRDKPKPFQITELELGVLQRNLSKLEKEEKLGTDDRWLDFYNRIMNAKEAAPAGKVKPGR